MGAVDSKNIEARAAFMLAYCPPFEMAMFRELVNKYNDVFALDNYEIWLKLAKIGNKFKLETQQIKFRDNSARDAEQMCKFFGMPFLTTRSNAYALSFPELVKRAGGSKYLFCSVVVDFSIDNDLVHQCALLVDIPNTQFIFYEPYGTYIKYEADYSGAIEEFLLQYRYADRFYKDPLWDRVVMLARGKLDYITYHAKFGLSEGIQNILLKQNNAKASYFYEDLASLYEKLQPSQVAYLEHLIAKDNDPVNATDLTYKCTTPIEFLMRHKIRDHMDDALDLFYNYTSKSCVSITLVELDWFFAGKPLLALYVGISNERLFDLLLQLIHSLQNSRQIINVLDRPMDEICVMADETL